MIEVESLALVTLVSINSGTRFDQGTFPECLLRTA